MPRSIEEEIVVDGPPAWFDEVNMSRNFDDAPAVEISAKSFVWRPESELPPRRWLYGRHLIRKFLSVDVAAGGIGKSSVKIVEALAMVTGRNLLGRDVHEGPMRVWLYNLEDPHEEIERRIHAACKHYQISAADIGDRLFVNSGREQPMCIAEDTGSGARIVRPVSDRLIECMLENAIDVFSIDPFVSAHSLSENDNVAVDLVAKEFGRIADVTNSAFNLVHHVRKGNGAEANADSARGASSLIGAARSVVVYNRMTPEEAALAGITPEQRGFYFRTQNDKANLSPPESAEWHRMNNVDLENGDSVGVACPWEWPDLFDCITKENTRSVQRAVASGQFRKDPRASNWVGNIISTVLGMDPDEDKKRLSAVIKQWLKTDVLREVEGVDETRRQRLFVEVGTWLTD